MPDLSEQIREYVDAVEEPVSVDDVLAVVQRGSDPASRNWNATYPRRRRHGRVLFGAAAAVVATAALLAVLVGLPGGGVSHDGSPSAAAAVLSSAAHTARAAKPVVLGPGQVLNLSQQFLVHGLVQGSDKQYAYNVAGSARWSLNQSGTGTEQINLGDPTFPTAADRAAWIALGSLNLVPSHVFSEPFPLSAAQTSANATDNGLGALPTTPTVLPYSVVATLPTAPAALEKQLIDQYENGHLDVGQTFDLAAGLLEEGAGPAQRSALYRMVASLPGVAYDGSAITDITRQAGVEVSVSLDGVKRELIFNPSTSAVLEERNVPGPSWPTDTVTPQSPGLEGPVDSQILGYTVFQSSSVAPS